VEDRQDAFGHAFLDYLHHPDPALCSIIERDDGLFDVDPVHGYFAEYPDWPPHQQQAMEYAQGAVLDVGCGAGRHALYLQARGLDVLGVDQSPLAIEVCRLRGLEKTRVASITQVSHRLGQFDTILMMGNNLGLLASYQRARWLLRRFWTLTTAHGRIIAETLDPYQTLDPLHLEYQAWNRNRGRMSGQIRLRLRYRKYEGPLFDYLFVSREELARIVHGTGWNVWRILDSADARYVAVLDKVEP